MTTTKVSEEQLVSFFRLGKLKKFYQNIGSTSSEITFFDAAKLLECKPAEPRATIPSKQYFQLLDTNKAKFQLDTVIAEEDEGKGGRSNLHYIETRLKEKSFKACKQFTDSDEDFISGVRSMLSEGRIAKKTAQVIKKELKKTIEPLQVLGILRKHIRSIAVDENRNGKDNIKREVILSGYLTN